MTILTILTWKIGIFISTTQLTGFRRAFRWTVEQRRRQPTVARSRFTSRRTTCLEKLLLLITDINDETRRSSWCMISFHHGKRCFDHATSADDDEFLLKRNFSKLHRTKQYAMNLKLTKHSKVTKMTKKHFNFVFTHHSCLTYLLIYNHVSAIYFNRYMRFTNISPNT